MLTADQKETAASVTIIGLAATGGFRDVLASHGHEGWGRVENAVDATLAQLGHARNWDNHLAVFSGVAQYLQDHAGITTHPKWYVDAKRLLVLA